MINKTIKIIMRLARSGVIHRDEVKNDMDVVRRLVYHGFVRKVCRDRKVFYELTDKSLPLIESRRKAMLEEIKILAELHKSPSVFHALLNDIRFLDERHHIAEQFKFLGDWQIHRPVVPSQLQLVKLKYYQKLKGAQNEV